MKKNNMILRINCCLFFLILVLLINIALSKSANAGIYLEEEISTNITGKEFIGIKKTYLSENKALIIDPMLTSKIVLDFNAGKVYLIDDVKKNLSTSEIDNFDFPVNDKIYSYFGSLQESDLYSKESGQTKKIGTYECYEKVVYIPRIASLSRIWISNNIEPKVDALLSLLEKNKKDILLKTLLPLLKERNAYIINCETNIIRQDEINKYLYFRLNKISNQEIPEETFNIPQDYTKVNKVNEVNPEKQN